MALVESVLLACFCLTCLWRPCTGRESLPLTEETKGEGCSAAPHVSGLLKDLIYFFLSKRLQAVVSNEVASNAVLQSPLVLGSADGQGTKALVCGLLKLGDGR